MKLIIKKGTTSKRVPVFVQNSSSTTGAGLTGLVFNSAGLTWYYWREDEGNVGATSVTLATATRGTYTSGGFIEKDATNMPGCYEIGVPNAALATGAGWVTMMLKGATNMAPLPIEIELVDNIVSDVITDTTAIIADTNDIQTRLPAALVGGRMDSSAGAVTAGAGQAVADEVLNRDLAGGASGGARNVRNALRVLRNRTAIAAGTMTVYQENDTSSAWTAAVTTAAGNPIAEIDPA